MTNSKSARGVQKISLSSIAKILQHIYYSIDSTQFQWIDIPGALELELACAAAASPQPAPCASGDRRGRPDTHIFYFLNKLNSLNFMQILALCHAGLGGSGGEQYPFCRLPLFR